MKSSHKYLYILAAVVILSCLQSCQQHEETIISKNTVHQDENHENVSDTSSVHVASQPFQDFANVRQPDKRVRARKGHALLIETEGLSLAATDTAVIRSDTYSVTSLFPEELPPLPQGMMNMTAATAGYRLLPGGEHFRPYAELRMSYDPERLPQGYTPYDIYTSFYDTATLAWVRLERVGVDTVNHEIVSLTTHFTDFINELLKAPEMPETQAFVPTALSNLEAANPTDGLILATPPEANNNGTTNLSYPLWIPAGRANMQPKLTLSYSSTGGNGWLGIGWDIYIPSVTIDTRWGVPRYNASKETEIYLLDGEQLITKETDGTPRAMPHRTNQQSNRLPDGTQFYARTGDAHDSIIRHDTLTSTYWWEVVDRYGVTHYYGHYPDSPLNTSLHPTTLKDDRGNIAKWMLAESRDPYGNWVRYYYDLVTVGGTVPGRQIYLEHIEYTGNNNERGEIRVDFVCRDRDPRDVPVSCNLGFKETTSKELCYIRAYLDTCLYTDTTYGTNYYFEKEVSESSNFKTRLKSVLMTAKDEGSPMKWCTHHDTADPDYSFNHLDFQYYDAPAPSSLFSEEYQSNVDDAGLTAFVLTPGFRTDSVTSATALGLSQSSNWSIGGTLGIGLGTDVAWTKTSIGGNFHWSESSSESLSMLIDIDGDGIADKVYTRGGSLYWQKQLVSSDSSITVNGGSAIDGPGHFLLENSSTATLGVQASVAPASGSANWSKTTSTTSTYFADVDGDGLVDLVVDGQVYFNRIVNNEPKFSRYREAPIIEDEDEPTMQQIACGSIIFDGQVDTNVACDRIWKIESISSKTYDYTSAAEIAQSYSIDEDHSAIITPTDTAGEYRITFYYAEMDCSRRNLAGIGVPNTESVRAWVAPDTGSVSIDYHVRLLKDTNVYKYRHVDGITYVIQQSKGVVPVDHYSLHSAHDSIIDTMYICDTCWNDEEFFSNSLYDINVDSGDIILFRLQSMNDKQLDNIEDSIIITFSDTLNRIVEYNSNSSFVLTDNKYFTAPFNGQYSLEIDTNHIGSDINLNIVRPSSSSIAQDEIIQLIANSTDTNANWGNVDVRAKIKYWSDSIADTMTIWTVGRKDILHPDTCIWGDTTYQNLFGPLYNGWGQFTYHPHDANNKIIPLDSLIVPKRVTVGQENSSGRAEIINQINTPVDSAGFNSPNIDTFENSYGSYYNPMSESSCWVEMNADAEHNRWVAFGAHNSIGRKAMSNTMQKEWYNLAKILVDTNEIFLPPTSHHDDAVPPAAFDGTPAKAIVKVNISSNQNYAAGVAMVNVAYSHGTSNIDMDYIDMNGDRYPDIVGPGYVQYRQQWGGMGNSKGLPPGINIVSSSETNSIGAGFGASPSSHNRTTSTNPAKAKFTISGDGSSFNSDLNVGLNNSSSSWTDINGDGLPDYVTADGYVRLNTGYDFLNSEDWNFGANHALQSGMSASGSSSIGVPITNLAQGSIQVGAGLSRSVNRTDHTLMDINGDGLPDLVWRNPLDLQDVNRWAQLIDTLSSVHVMFNLGNGQWSEQYDLNIKNFNWSEAYNESLNIGATAGFAFWGIKATVGINATPYSSGTNRDRLQLVDVNGDGLPDLVTSNQEDKISIRYNMGGKTNLLRKVTNFTGSEINLCYTLSTPDYMQPSRTWLLDTVTTHDPLNPNGGDTSVTIFEYSNPNYNRFERAFWGYGTVVTKQLNPSDGSVYRKIERNYCNTDILKKRRILRELTSDGNDNKYIEKVYQHEYAANNGIDMDSCIVNAYNSMDRIVTRYYEGYTHPKMTVAETFRYDRYHNVVTYIDEGDTAYSDDGAMARFSYYANQSNNLIGLRKDFTILPADSSTILRENQFVYNSEGKLTKQTLGTGPNSPVYEFEYDTIYGNIIRRILPRNDNHQRMEYHYTYDDFLHAYPVRIENSFHDTTTFTYDYHIGKPKTITDQCGNTMTYMYDYVGRLVTIRSPMNISNHPSLRVLYYTDSVSYSHAIYGAFPHQYYLMHHSRPYTISEHIDDTGALITRTVVITDGFGRVLQTKKGLTENGTEKMQVSGRTMTDAFGRTVRQYDPFTVSDTALHTLGQFAQYMDSSATVTSYDVLDRVTEVRQPLNVTTYTAYDIGNDTSGQRRFVTTFTDPNGNVTKQYSDYDGRRVQLTADANGIAATTLIHYDNLGQLEYTLDPEGFQTSYGYDNLGRLIYRNHSDAGITLYEYDPAGNITKETNPLGEIFYDYEYNRPTYKRYSYMTGNDVTYEYGTSGNDRGRLWRITDGSGMYECRYDKLGNVTEETRTIALPHNNDVAYRFFMGYSYDSWGRMNRMLYPDGEKIAYTYQWGGDLSAMYGNKNGNHRTYVRKIYYNSFGQKENVIYGNGTIAYYTYDALHRLSYLQSYDSLGNPMQKIDYTFDNASNVVRITNSSGVVNALGGGYENKYYYDNLNRLTSSNGSGIAGLYDMIMKYTPSGRIIQKRHDAHSNSVSENVEMAYGYCDDYQPHTVKRMFNYNNGMLYDMRWDDAGNLGQVSMGRPGDMFETGRFLFWTEDNRMHTAVDDRYYSYYTYDYSGERRLKLTGDNKLMDVNAYYMETYTILNEPTLYPSAYMVLTPKGYTKHYYAGTERVAARIGRGGLEALYHPIVYNDTLQEKANDLFGQSQLQVNDRVLNENDLVCIMNNEFAVEEFDYLIEDIPHQMHVGVEFDLSQFKDMVYSMLDEHNHGQEKEVYFYHSDHLGSASWITDSIGIPIQHLQYLPYGEPYVDQHPFGYSERFTFTGKERDEETGYGYFGARYMDHELMTMWLSVDQMADKYPSISPYAYCAWNPIKLVDPDGKEMTDFKDKKGNLIKHIEDGQDVSYVIKGTGAHEHFEYESGDITAKNIDYQTGLAIQEQQSYNMQNNELKENDAGQTFCNYATQNVQQTVESIPGNDNVVTMGRANKMANDMATSDNYITVSQQEALQYAEQGYLVVSSWINPTGQSGHVATLSVGSNRGKGREYANIGPAKYSGFTTFGASYGKNKRPHVQHHVYMRSSCKPVQIIASKPN